MENHGLDPETEKAVRAALSDAEEEVRQDGIVSMANYIRATFDAFRKAGFSKKQSYSFAVMLYQSLLAR